MEGNFLKMPNGQEGNNLMRKSSHISEEKFDNLKEDWEKRTILYSEAEVTSFFDKYELKMTSRHREIFEFVIEQVNDFLEEYELGKSRASMDQIKLVKNKFFEYLKSPDASATYFPQLQIIAIDGDMDRTNTSLADSAFHEFMHYFSFQRSVLRGGKSDGYADIKEERVGISISSKNDQNYKYYKAINEAITVELTMRFWKKMSENKLFKDDIWKLKNEYGSDTKYSVLMMKKDVAGNVEPEASVSYRTEHMRTQISMREIYEKNLDSFNSPSDVMEFFIKAYFSGRLLPIARLLEKTYGKGSFRAIGEETA